MTLLTCASEHLGYSRIAFISGIFPLEKFTEICRKVYFAVDDYSEIDFILVNGYLSYIFSEHVVISGLEEYREYCRICRENFHNALLRLPLLLPVSMETIAVLTLGVGIPQYDQESRIMTNFHCRYLTQLKILKLQWLGLSFRLHRVFARR